MSAMLGVPYANGGTTVEGADCWGIVTLWLKEVVGIEVILGMEYPPADRFYAEIAKRGDWQPISGDRQRADVLMFSSHNLLHAGVMLSSYQMLHTDKTRGSHVVNLRLHDHLEGRLLGAYRHTSFA